MSKPKAEPKADVKIDLDDEPDYDNFNKAVTKFFEFCEKVLNYNNVGSVVNPIVVKMNKFIKVYDYMDDDEKVEFINTNLYEPYIKSIISSDEDYTWITKASITLAIDKKMAKDRSLMFSTIYNKCTKLRDDAEKSIEDLPDTAAEGREELNFPEIFCLYFYRILKHSLTAVKDKNTEKVTNKLSGIEKVLGVGDTNPEIKSNPLPAMQNILGNLGNLGSLGNLITHNPKNKQMPININFDGVKNLVNGFAGDSNPQLKNMVNGIIGELKEAKSPQEMIQKAVSKIGGGSDIMKMIQAESNVPDAIEQDVNEMKSISDAEINQLRLTGKMPETVISSAVGPSSIAATQLHLSQLLPVNC